MLKKRWVYFNDAFIPWEEATVHVASHSFARGSAIFEVLSLHETRFEPMIFRLDEHVSRLFQSARFLEMKMPVTPESLQDRVKETVRKNGMKKGVIKIICCYPEIALDILPPSAPLTVIIFVVNPDEDLPEFKAAEKPEASACISRWRKLDPQTVPVEAKASANYLNGMMARMEAKKRGFDQAILLDTQGFVAEGGTESVFMVKNGVLMTPIGGTILQSITRKSLLEVSSAKGIETREMRILPQLFLEADEVFLSCTPLKVLPLMRIDDRSLPGASGPVVKTLVAMMQKIIEGEDQAFEKWRFPVNGVYPIQGSI
ncbi:MAG: hypothetical protein COX20_05980 [Desulfobacterales bacterium CG23_combo_of_CG06-09_8_20_14_all_52_9]|nr:MAG: hypothetical protein COX20_05980 [Desulfobacterales bacterium CG23_combo_of_CG06-09_8_20_14_all_52_9]